jgi:hypothetical protein
MRIVLQRGDRLIVEVGDPGFARVLVVLSGVSLIAAAIVLFAVPRGWRAESFQGLVLGAVLFLGAFVAVFERATFDFDRAARRLTWRRRRIFGSRSGSVPFEQIREVVLQTSPASSHANPKRRVALLLEERELPLSVGYAPDVGGAARALVETLTRFVKQRT